MSTQSATEGAAASASSPAVDAAASAASASAAMSASMVSDEDQGEGRRRWAIVALLALGIGGAVWWAARDPQPAATATDAIAQAERDEPPTDSHALAEAARPDAEQHGAAVAIAPPRPVAAPDPAPPDAAPEGDVLIIDDEPTDEAPAEPTDDPTDDPSEEPADAAPPPAEATDAPPPTAPSRPSGKSRDRRRTKATSPSPSTPAPRPQAPPKTPSSAPPADAATLLAEARKAYSAGNAAKAYRLAKQSNAIKKSTGATETMALASCQRRDQKTAYTLMKRLPLSRRSSVRDRCRTFGIRLGL